MEPRKHYSQALPLRKISKLFSQAASASSFPSTAPNHLPENFFLPMQLSNPRLELHFTIDNRHSKKVLVGIVCEELVFSTYKNMLCRGDLRHVT